MPSSCFTQCHECIVASTRLSAYDRHTIPYQGVPWEPVPGRKRTEFKARFHPREAAEIIAPPSTREVIPRRIYIRREDVSDSKYGLTSSCKGCEAANRGATGIHNEQCRKRVESEIEKNEPDRFNSVVQRLSSVVEESVGTQNLQEKENPVLRKKRRQEEVTYQEGSSSGSGSQQVPRVMQQDGIHMKTVT